MSELAYQWQNNFLDFLLHSWPVDPPTTYLGLSQADPLDDASGLKEPNGKSYRRMQVCPEDWNEASGGIITNSRAICFNLAKEDWGIITHLVVFDAAVGGNIIIYTKLGSGESVNCGDAPRLEPGDFDLAIS